MKIIRNIRIDFSFRYRISLYPQRIVSLEASIRFQGPKFFNSLSPEIQNSESIRLFVKGLKKFLLS